MILRIGVRSLYNTLFSLFFALSSPYYFMRLRRRGNWLNGFAERFGKYDTRLKQAITNRNVLWMHAVSVGEVNLCTHLIRAFEPRLPNIKNRRLDDDHHRHGRAQAQAPHHVSKIYYPLTAARGSRAPSSRFGPRRSSSSKPKSGPIFFGKLATWRFRSSW